MNAGPLIFLAAMVAVFWFLLIRPQRRQAAHQNLMAQLAPGDEVVTAGGMIGTLRSIEDLPRRRDRPGHGGRIAKEAVTGGSQKRRGIRRLGNRRARLT